MEQLFYDAKLLKISDGTATYSWQGQRLQRPASNLTQQQERVGQIGLLVVNEVSGETGFFQPYLEQRLRRAMQYDLADMWAWRLEGKEGIILVKSSVIPGIDGRVIIDETTPLLLAIPPEFTALCAEFKSDVEQVLRGFIADACGLQNHFKEPREDGYSSNGSDERTQAYDYLDRAYGILRGPYH